jgi:hypothetical protein
MSMDLVLMREALSESIDKCREEASKVQAQAAAGKPTTLYEALEGARYMGMAQAYKNVLKLVDDLLSIESAPPESAIGWVSERGIVWPTSMN